MRCIGNVSSIGVTRYVQVNVTFSHLHIQRSDLTLFNRMCDIVPHLTQSLPSPSLYLLFLSHVTVCVAYHSQLSLSISLSLSHLETPDCICVTYHGHLTSNTGPAFLSGQIPHLKINNSIHYTPLISYTNSTEQAHFTQNNCDI